MYVDSQYYDDLACSRGISIITILKKRVGLYIIGSLIIYNRSLINRTLIIYNQGLLENPIIYYQTSNSYNGGGRHIFPTKNSPLFSLLYIIGVEKGCSKKPILLK